MQWDRMIVRSWRFPLDAIGQAPSRPMQCHADCSLAGLKLVSHLSGATTFQVNCSDQLLLVIGQG